MVVCLVIDIDDTLFVHKTIGSAIVTDYNEIKPDTELKLLLKEIHHPKYILTNATFEHANDILNKLDVVDEFKKIYSRDNIPEMKPSLHCYQSVSRDIGITSIGHTSNQFIFFDDLVSNLEGAHKVGWKTIWISPDYMNSNKYPYINKAYPTLIDALKTLNF